jgi:uncharacterized surface protein with fasciclin (FAS1) repeats
MKISNKIVNLMLVAFVAIVTFSCSTSDDNKEVVVPKSSILDLAKADSQLSSLALALKVAKLDVPGSSPFGAAGSFTLFAPVNTAFDAYVSTNFPTGITNAALTTLYNAQLAVTATPSVPLTTAQSNQEAELKKLLQNHILGVGTKSNDLLPNTAAGITGYSKTFAAGVGSTTLSIFVNKVGSDVLVNGGATNGGAKVTSADVLASNGVIHIVDAMIKLPTLLNHIVANPDLSTLLEIVNSTAAIDLANGKFGDQSAVKTLIASATSNATYSTTNLNPSLTIFAPLNTAFATATATGGFITGTTLTAADITKVLQYHVSASLPATTVVAGNLTAASATSWASADATIKTLALNTVPANQTFKIEKSTLKITEIPVQTTAASLMKTVNIQATNGVIHTIDRVLKPVF